MKNEYVAIITGDIVDSRKSNATKWLESLKTVLNTKGQSPIDWEIFRGDMFQLEVKPYLSLETALAIKARIKQHKNLDVRIAIGIGTNQYKANKITESNGEAYTHSGFCFENLKKKKLAIKTPWKDFDKQWNLTFQLLSLTIDDWTPVTAKIIEEVIENSNLNQTELAKKLNRSQSTISDSLNRAAYDEIKLTQSYFVEQIHNRINRL